MFIVAPVLLGIAARKIYGRSGALWGFFTLITNGGVLIYFDFRLGFSSVGEAADELGVVLIIGTLFILVALELLQSFPHEVTKQDILRRGVLRLWASISAAWIILCSFELPSTYYSHYRDFFSRAVFDQHYQHPDYFNVAKTFVGVPILGFVIGLVICWVVDGFKRSTPN